jgi:hypothetical protein
MKVFAATPERIVSWAPGPSTPHGAASPLGRRILHFRAPAFVSSLATLRVSVLLLLG